MIKQLIYLSRANSEFSQSDIDDLVDKANLKNKALGISGILIYRDGYFVQFIEGPIDNISQLYSSIQSDPRHEIFSLIYQREGNFPKFFEDWQMKHISEKFMGIENTKAIKEFIDKTSQGITLDKDDVYAFFVGFSSSN